MAAGSMADLAFASHDSQLFARMLKVRQWNHEKPLGQVLSWQCAWSWALTSFWAGCACLTLARKFSKAAMETGSSRNISSCSSMDVFQQQEMGEKAQWPLFTPKGKFLRHVNVLVEHKSLPCPSDSWVHGESPGRAGCEQGVLTPGAWRDPFKAPARASPYKLIL